MEKRRIYKKMTVVLALFLMGAGIFAWTKVGVTAFAEERMNENEVKNVPYFMEDGIEFIEPNKVLQFLKNAVGYFDDEVKVKFTAYTDGDDIEKFCWKYIRNDMAGEVNVAVSEGECEAKESAENGEKTEESSGEIKEKTIRKFEGTVILPVKDEDGESLDYNGYLTVVAVDKSGNSSEEFSSLNQDYINGFVVDHVSPEMEVTHGAADGETVGNVIEKKEYFNQDVKFRFLVKEANFQLGNAKFTLVTYDREPQEEEIKLETMRVGDDLYESEFTLGTDGEYRIKAEYTDVSGALVSYESDVIVVDKTMPTGGISVEVGTDRVSIKAEDPNMEYIDTKVYRMTKSGALIDETSRLSPELSGNGMGMTLVTFAEVENVKEMDGNYVAQLFMRDKAGNENYISRTFCVDRFGPVIEPDDYAGGIIKRGRTVLAKPERDLCFDMFCPIFVKKEDINMEVTRNGVLQDKVNFTFEAVAENHEVSGVNIEYGDDIFWKHYRLVIDKKNFEKDGSYKVNFVAKDEAGSTGSLADLGVLGFVTDSYAPELISVIGIESKRMKGEVPVKFRFTDLYGLKSIKVFAGSKTTEITEFEDIYMYEGMFLLEPKEGEQHIRFVAEDLAGNVFDSDEVKTGFNKDVTIDKPGLLEGLIGKLAEKIDEEKQFERKLGLPMYEEYYEEVMSGEDVGAVNETNVLGASFAKMWTKAMIIIGLLVVAVLTTGMIVVRKFG